MQHNLYIARREAQLKQIDVARHLNISGATYSLKESGKSQFTIAEGLVLTKLFNCTLNDLFQKEETM